MNYEFAGKKGITSILTAVQVTEMVEFVPTGGGVDFDIVGEATGEADLF